MNRVYAAEWTLTEEPSEELEARIHAAGYQVYWHDTGHVTVEVDAQLDDPHLSLLEELVLISSPGSWVLWWTDADLARDDRVMVSVATDRRLLTLSVDRPPDIHRQAPGTQQRIGTPDGDQDRDSPAPQWDPEHLEELIDTADARRAAAPDNPVWANLVDALRRATGRAGKTPGLSDVTYGGSNREVDAAILAGVERLGDRRLVDELLAQGQAVLYVVAGDIVREHPDGTREIVGRLKRPPLDDG